MTALLDRLQQALGTAYRIERELGGGGMSHVFVAEETALGRRVVVKVLPPDLASGLSADRFRREIHLAAQLQHPGIVPVLSAGAQDDLLWYVMPFVEGESLRTRLARGPLPIDEAVRLWRDLLEALEYAHGRGIVHRDIKPENVMLTGRRAVTLDFGVAKAVRASTGVGTGATAMTGIGLVLGTPAYMAPEQAAGDGAVDGRADLYAAGLVLYEMLAGRGPFDARTPAEQMAAHIAAPPMPIAARRAEVDAALATMVMACLAKSPSERPTNATALLVSLEGLSTRSGVVAIPKSTVSRRGIALGAIAAMTISTVAFFTLRGRTTNENPSANAFATLADSSRLQVAFLPVVAGPQDSLLARTLVSAQIRALQGDRRVLLRTPDQIAALAVTADYPVTSSPDSLKTFYRDLGVHAYVVNTIARTGSGALLVAEGYATNSDSVLFRVEAPANSAADLSAATASLTEGTLAGARRSFGKVFPPLRVGRLFGTTAEAARLYAESGEYFARQEYLTVVKKMRLALSIDSNFVIGWSTLAAALGNGNLGAAERFEASRQAYRLRSQIRSRVARVSAETQYLLAVGDAEGALAVAKAGTREFPTASDLKILLALVYARRREDELAMQVLRPVAEQELDRRQLWVGVGNFGLELLRLGRIAEAEALSRRSESVVGRMTVGTVQQRYGIAQATFDVEGIAQAGRDRLALATTEPTRLAGYSILRTAMAMSGRLDSASHIEAKRRSILRELEVGLLGVQSIADEALWRAMFLGDRSRSVALLDSGLVAWNWSALPSLDRSYPFVVQVRVAAGHIAEARRLVDEWERGVPEDLARAQRPLIEWARGEIALAEGRAPESLTHFRAGDVGGCRSCVFPRLARAFDGMQNADSTIYWYEKYLATPTFDPNVDSRELARAYRRLGELYDAKGDTKRALRRYSDFVELWKNADPALQPTVKVARERIARLQRTKG